MPSVIMMHVPLGDARLEDVAGALPLTDPELNMSLGHRFRQRLRDTPLHFLETLGLLDYPLLRLQWMALCPTAGLVMLRGNAAEPEVWCLLLNGLEDVMEIQSIQAHCPMFAGVWPRIEEEERPLAVSGYVSAGWRANPAVVTVLGAFANAFFTQFGESG